MPVHTLSSQCLVVIFELTFMCYFWFQQNCTSLPACGSDLQRMRSDSRGVLKERVALMSGLCCNVFCGMSQ